MDVCEAAAGQVITGLLQPKCRDGVDDHALRCACSLTFLHHADTQTLLKAAVLAAVASPLVHRTVLTGQTHILGVFLHGALRRERRDRHTDNQPPNTINHLIFDLFNSISVFFLPPSSLPHQRMKAEARRSDFNYALKGGGDINIIR